MKIFSLILSQQIILSSQWSWKEELSRATFGQDCVLMVYSFGTPGAADMGYGFGCQCCFEASGQCRIRPASGRSLLFWCPFQVDCLLAIHQYEKKTYFSNPIQRICKESTDRPLACLYRIRYIDKWEQLPSFFYWNVFIRVLVRISKRQKSSYCRPFIFNCPLKRLKRWHRPGSAVRLMRSQSALDQLLQ